MSSRQALQDAVKTGSSKTYPEPVGHCDICRWWKECDDQWRRDDHLSLVAGASGLQRKELALQGIFSLESLANLAIPISFNPSRGGREGYTRIREQARIQLEARRVGLKSELLFLEPDKGFFRLPSPSIGDIFLDLEGDPFVGEGDLNTSFGLVTTNDDGNLVYQSRWALDRAQERIAFEWFIDLAFERIVRFPDLHIYHYRILRTRSGETSDASIRHSRRRSGSALARQSICRSPQHHKAKRSSERGAVFAQRDGEILRIPARGAASGGEQGAAFH